MRRSKTPRPSPVAVFLGRHGLLRLIKARHRLTAVDRAGLSGLRPPYIVVANHTNFWDPFWINAFVPHPVQFVASDNLFRSLFLGALMRLLGAIPKTKRMNDLDAVGQLLRVIRASGVVGIFPEGARTHDGRTIGAEPGVSKLLKKARLPVVRALVKGGYLAKPRWARFARRGGVRVEYDLLFTAERLASLDVGEVRRLLDESLAYDELAEQRLRMRPFPARRPAEFLERLLFVCARCEAFSALVSSHDRLRCAACGYAVRVDETGFLRPESGPARFDHLGDWNAWQLSALSRKIEREGLDRDPLFSESSAVLWEGFRARPLTRRARGEAVLLRSAVEFRRPGSPTLSFPLDRIEGVNIQNREKLELYCDGVLYRLDFTDPRSSSYKWEQAIACLQARSERSFASAR